MFKLLLKKRERNIDEIDRLTAKKVVLTEIKNKSKEYAISIYSNAQGTNNDIESIREFVKFMKDILSPEKFNEFRKHVIENSFKIKEYKYLYPEIEKCLKEIFFIDDKYIKTIKRRKLSCSLLCFGIIFFSFTQIIQFLNVYKKFSPVFDMFSILCLILGVYYMMSL